MGKTEINEEALYKFVSDATKCVLEEIKSDVSFYSNAYWDELLSVNGLNKKKLAEFIIYGLDGTEDEDKVCDLLSNVMEKCDESQIQIFSGTVSADAYTRRSYLCILKLSEKYYCFYNGDENIRFVTIDPLEFFIDCVEEEESHHVMEKEGNKDGDFEDFTVSLDFNF